MRSLLRAIGFTALSIGLVACGTSTSSPSDATVLDSTIDSRASDTANDRRVDSPPTGSGPACTQPQTGYTLCTRFNEETTARSSCNGGVLTAECAVTDLVGRCEIGGLVQHYYGVPSEAVDIIMRNCTGRGGRWMSI